MSDSTRFIVLAAVDMSASSTLVMERAMELAASRSGGEVHVVTVFEPELPIGVFPGLAPARPQLLTGIEEVAGLCRGVMERMAEERPLSRVPSVHLHGLFGRVPDEIVWLAAHLNADFVVTATHGRRGLKRLLLGSVAEKVVRLAGCPVVVVRDKGHDGRPRSAEVSGDEPPHAWGSATGT